MILKIKYQGQEFTAVTRAEAFGDALDELFINSNYCLTSDANHQTVAYGIDFLRGSVITIAPNAQPPVIENVKATLEQYAAGRACYDRIINLTSQLISEVKKDKNHAHDFMGAFNPNVERLVSIGVISKEIGEMVKGIKSAYINTSQTNYNVTASQAQSVVDSSANAEVALNSAIENWRNRNL
ncbi:MAG: hypothetical protein ABIN01_03825 [Ferruginibacter sp.]